MKTFTRNNVSNIKQAKKAAKNLRDLRKRGGNISLFEASGTPKRNFVHAQDESHTEGWDWREGWDG